MVDSRLIVLTTLGFALRWTRAEESTSARRLIGLSTLEAVDLVDLRLTYA